MDGLLTNEKIKELENEYEILHLVYHRNKNQHRQQVWWKYLNILHRYIRKLLKLNIDIERIKSNSKIKYKKDQIIEIVRYLSSRNVFRKAYYEFNGIIALGQFIGLGFTLVGLLSKIYNILMLIEGIKPKPIESTPTNETNKVTTKIVSDDLGEIVEVDQILNEPHDDAQKRKVDSIDDIFDMLPSKKSKKSKKKKKKNDIDDIFG